MGQGLNQELENYQSLKEQLRALRQQTAEVAGRLIRHGLRHVFDVYPHVQSIGWTQYTPYFNDGDECLFGTHIDYPYINTEDTWDVDWSETSKHLRPVRDAIRTVLREVDNEDFLCLFGDHVKVTINRDGTAITEEYDHD